MDKQVISYTYDSIIPLQYLEQANDFVSYLKYYPFLYPSNCKRCGSRNFSEKSYQRPNSKRNIPTFFCRDCKRNFNQTTNTYFSGIIYLELLADFARLRFAGHSQETISQELGFSLATAKERDKLFLHIMSEEYPKLYAWWKPHQDFLDKRFSPQAKQERDLFIRWLKTYSSTKVIVCPCCNKTPSNTKQTEITCDLCNLSFTMVFTYNSSTREHHAVKWLPFVKGMIEGKSGHTLARELDISKPTASRWKQQFINQMQQFKFKHLLQWTTWQQSRGIASTTRQYRESKSKGF